MSDLILYSTEDCHLCEQALAIIRADPMLSHGSLALAVIDIVSDEDLMAQYGIRIPVLVAANSDAELGWPFDADAVNAFLTRVLAAKS